MTGFCQKIVVTLLVTLMFTSFALCEDKKTETKKKPKPEYPPLEKVVKGMKKQKGFFDLYQKDEKLYALIKSSQLKKPFMLAITLSGGIYAGMQWDNLMVHWEKQGKNLLLVRPDLRHRAPQTTLDDVVKRTYPSTIIRALPIMGKGSSGFLVDFNQIFKSDLAGVSQLSYFLVGSRSRLNSSLSRWSEVKTFPKNVELEVEAAFTGPAGMGSPPNWTDLTDGSRSQRMGIHYSLSFLPKSTYKPRKADSRIGFFNTAIKDFSKKHDARTHFLRYIHRWHLEKVDPSLKLSPPKNPIVFYMEDTIPYRFRRHVRNGILEWNKAFEKIGIVDAIVVRQQTDSEFADLDPEDIRYNFIRWTTNDFGFAAGPSRVHPLTGEILDADIIFDDSMLRYSAQSYEYNTPSAMLCEMDPKLKTMFEKFPDEKLAKRLGQLWVREQAAGDKAKAFHQALEMMAKRGQPICTYCNGMKHQLQLANVIMKEQGKKLPEEFVGEVVEEVVMHEIGHTLGLYHNFKGSSWLALDKINSEKRPEATSGSIMDYHPVNFTPKNIPQGHYLPRTIGPYDYWAIEYGYCFPGKDGEEKTLNKIASRCAEKGHDYGNDFYATFVDSDPLLIRWDLGDDPIAYAKLRISLVEELQKDLLNRVVAEGEDYYPARRAFSTLLFDYFYVTLLAGHNIGGEYLHWDHKGDPNARNPFVVVPAAKQREALEFLAGNIFSEKAFDFPSELLNHLAPGVWWHWESDEMSMWANYPVHEQILWMQSFVLLVLINPTNLQRLHDSPLQVTKGQDAFTIAELLDGLTKAIWSELDTRADAKKWSENSPYISSMRRNLQRMYLTVWIYYFVLDNYVFLVPEDARTIAWQNLNELDDKLKNTLKKQDSLDRVSKAHLMESQARIKQALKAKFTK